jgi:hypothetical protein
LQVLEIYILVAKLTKRYSGPIEPFANEEGASNEWNRRSGDG